MVVALGKVNTPAVAEPDFNEDIVAVSPKTTVVALVELVIVTAPIEVIWEKLFAPE